MTDPMKTSKSIFLPKEIEAEERPDAYNFQEELERIKKNRSYPTLFLVTLFMALLIGFTLYFTRAVEKKNRSIDVDITAFKDLRLDELVDALNRNENNLELLTVKLRMLKIEMDQELLTIEEERDNQRWDIIFENLPYAREQQKLARLKDVTDKKLAEIKKSYDTQVGQQEQKIITLSKALSKNTSSLQDRIKKEGGFNNSQRRLYEIKLTRLKEAFDREMKSQKSYYERRIDALTLQYNPIFKSSRIHAILSEKKDDKHRRLSLNNYQDLLKKERVLSKKAHDSLREAIEDYQFLIHRMTKIGYLNSVRPSWKTADRLTQKIITDYEELWTGLVSVVKDKNSTIADKTQTINRQAETINSQDKTITGQVNTIFDQNEAINKRDVLLEKQYKELQNHQETISKLKQTFDHLPISEKGIGFILNNYTPDHLLIHIKKGHEPKPGDTFWIFRGYKRIGQLRTTRFNIETGYQAQVVTLDAGETIKPLDEIRIK